MTDDDVHLDLTSTFHEVGRLFPGETQVETVAPTATARAALKTMLENRYSQLPVVEGSRVRGVFSLWSLAREMVAMPRHDLDSLLVEDAMEQVPSVTVHDSLHEVLKRLAEYEVLLVSSPTRLQAIMTAADVLQYFYRIARPFVLLQEIELTLRALITECTQTELTNCIERAIGQKYRSLKQTVPRELHELSFEDYRMIVIARENWPLFQGTVGRNRDVVTTKLEGIRKIRNDVLHFKRDITVLEHETLAAVRDWLLDKVKTAQPPKPSDRDAV